jgi:hypothetical protein
MVVVGGMMSYLLQVLLVLLTMMTLEVLMVVTWPKNDMCTFPVRDRSPGDAKRISCTYVVVFPSSGERQHKGIIFEHKSTMDRTHTLFLP